MSTRKNQKGQKNVPFFYDEVKERHTVLLTPSTWSTLKEKANKEGTSVSELIEQWVRDTTG